MSDCRRRSRRQPLVQAQPALRKYEQALLGQESFGLIEEPQPSLRAVKVLPNDAAREIGLRIFTNMRVPEQSVIYKTFVGKVDSGRPKRISIGGRLAVGYSFRNGGFVYSLGRLRGGAGVDFAD